MIHFAQRNNKKEGRRLSELAMDYMYLAMISGVLGLAFAVFSARYVLRQDQGSERMMEISGAIKEGAIAFLYREYQVLTIFVVAVAIVLVILG